jgi:hypothetical protein
VLAKGPVAIILSGGAVFFWAPFTKRWRDAFRLLHPVAIASFCATALPWYILCARRNPDFFRVFIIEHNFKRFLTPEFQHIQPFWYYIPVLLVAILPWVSVAVWTSITGVASFAKSKEMNPDTIFLLSWSSFAVLFFSLSQSKLPGYILPAIPALGLLLARSRTKAVIARRKSLALTLTAFGLLCFAASKLVIHQTTLIRSPALPLKFPFVILILTIALANALLAAEISFKTGWMRSLAALLCVISMLSLLVAEDALASGQFRFSSRDLAVQLLAHHVPADRIFIYDGIGRSDRYSLNFYLHREVPDWDENSRVEGYIVSDTYPCEHLSLEGIDCGVVLLGFRAGWFVSHVTPKNQWTGMPMGGRRSRKNETTRFS